MAQTRARILKDFASELPPQEDEEEHRFLLSTSQACSATM
jgi:hypothetical protein